MHFVRSRFRIFSSSSRVSSLLTPNTILSLIMESSHVSQNFHVYARIRVSERKLSKSSPCCADISFTTVIFSIQSLLDLSLLLSIMQLFDQKHLCHHLSCFLYLVAILQVPAHAQWTTVMTGACGLELVHATVCTLPEDSQWPSNLNGLFRSRLAIMATKEMFIGLF